MHTDIYYAISRSSIFFYSIQKPELVVNKIVFDFCKIWKLSFSIRPLIISDFPANSQSDTRFKEKVVRMNTTARTGITHF